MTVIHADLLAILDVVDIRSPGHYSLLGVSHEIPEEGPKAASLAVGTDRRVALLAADLYERLYLRPIKRPRQIRDDALARRDLISALSAANTGRGSWEYDWTVRAVEEDGQIVVAREGVDFWVRPTRFRTRDGSIQPGERCHVFVAKERRGLMPHFYLALGNEPDDIGEGADALEPLDRYYWHLTSSVAVLFVGTVTSLLNAARIPFRAKVLSNPNAYQRADAGVLYVRRRFQGHVAPIITRIHSAVCSGLRSKVPLFTLPLAAGLGFAEDPGGSLSFGQHRCQLAAEGLWQSFVQGEFDRDRRAETMASVLLREDLDPLRPYLGRGSREVPSLQPLLAIEAMMRVNVSRSRMNGPAEMGAERPVSMPLIEAATRIGLSLCRSAYWDSEGVLCNWMGRSIDEVSEYDGPITPTAAALAPDLYGGSGGIALFLAQLHAMTGEPEFRRTALGAIHRSIRQLGRTPLLNASAPLSFFFGHLGVLHAAREIGGHTGHSDLFEQAGPILAQVVEAVSAPHLLDVIGGSAGAIPVLLDLGQEPGLGRFRELAIVLGEELCRSAIRQDKTCSWEPEAASGPGMARTPLTGLSHGAAGIGLALLELYATTGRSDFLETARGAFQYEDSLFNPQEGNWPDLRMFERTDATDARPRFSVAWCHGAPGIALSRLKAAALDSDRKEDYLASARIAIATTLDAIDQDFEHSRADATLCHGLSGLIEVALVAGQVLDDPSCRERALDAAQALIDRHAASGDWPSGVPSGGPNPSLMLGSAGIGYTFLRLHAPEKLPSILLHVPESAKRMASVIVT